MATHNALAGKVAVVTGSGRGIGRGIAEQFAAAGASVLVATRGRHAGEEVVGAITDAGNAATLHVVDLSSRRAAEGTIQAAVDAYGGLDILVHNAGIYPIALIEDLTDEALDEILTVNLKSAFWLTRYAAAAMLSRGQGRLLFTSSVTGPRVAMPGLAAYAASKGGLTGFIRTAALEYARDRITVNAVEPGFILTGGLDAFGSPEEIETLQSGIPVGRLGSLDDVAAAMIFLASSGAGYITGQSIVVDGGALLPENAQALKLLPSRR